MFSLSLLLLFAILKWSVCEKQFSCVLRTDVSMLAQPQHGTRLSYVNYIFHFAIVPNHDVRICWNHLQFQR